MGVVKLCKLSESDLDAIDRAPTFSAVAASVAKGFAGADFAGYHVEFDLKFLTEECRRAGQDIDISSARVFDAARIFFRKHPRHLTDAVREYLGDAVTDGETFHGALADAIHAEHVLEAQLRRWSDVPRAPEALDVYCRNAPDGSIDRNGKIVWNGNDAALNFGKWKGVPLASVSRDYLSWAIGQDFPVDTKTILRDALAGKFPKKESQEAAHENRQAEF